MTWLALLVASFPFILSVAGELDPAMDDEGEDDVILDEPELDTEGEDTAEEGTEGEEGTGAEGEETAQEGTGAESEDTADEAVDDPAADDPAEEEPVPEDTPETIVFTEDAEVFNGTDGADRVDMAGGDDTANGGAETDVLIGGTGSDVLNGGTGDDILFSTSEASGDASDSDVDQLDGEEGDDILYLGTGDIGRGGAGADSFVARQDVTGGILVEDFAEGEDALIVEIPAETNVSVTGAEARGDDMVITLSNGVEITLRGVAALSEDPSALVSFVEV